MSALDAIIKEAGELEAEAALAARAHFLNSRKWQKRGLYLGLPATILAAVAGVTAFGELHSGITGGVAMTVAALTAVSTFLNPADRASAYRTSSASFSQIRRGANLLRDVRAQMVADNDEAAIKALVEGLEELTARMNECEQGAQTLSLSSLEAARRDLGP